MPATPQCFSHLSISGRVPTQTPLLPLVSADALCLSSAPLKRRRITRPVCLSFISPTKPQSQVWANINSSLLTYLPVQRNIWPGSALSTTSGQAQISQGCVPICARMIHAGGQSEFSPVAVDHYKAITLIENLINRTCNAVTLSRRRGEAGGGKFLALISTGTSGPVLNPTADMNVVAVGYSHRDLQQFWSFLRRAFSTVMA